MKLLDFICVLLLIYSAKTIIINNKPVKAKDLSYRTLFLNKEQQKLKKSGNIASNNNRSSASNKIARKLKKTSGIFSSMIICYLIGLFLIINLFKCCQGTIGFGKEWMEDCCTESSRRLAVIDRKKQALASDKLNASGNQKFIRSLELNQIKKIIKRHGKERGFYIARDILKNHSNTKISKQEYQREVTQAQRYLTSKIHDMEKALKAGEPPQKIGLKELSRYMKVKHHINILDHKDELMSLAKTIKERFPRYIKYMILNKKLV